MKKLVLFGVFSINLILNLCNAQTLAITGNILLNSQPATEGVYVTIVETTDTAESFSNTYRANSTFNCLLIDDRNYVLIFNRPGYQPKCITISTHHNSRKRFNYEFSVNLTDYDKVSNIPKYTGGIYYNRTIRSFDYFIIN